MAEQAVQRYMDHVRAVLWDIAERRAPEIGIWMQMNRPWTDRTHNARLLLNFRAEQVAQYVAEIVLWHGVEYGWYLEGFTPEGIETRQGGKYAILAPAVDHWGPILMQELRTALEG